MTNDFLRITATYKARIFAHSDEYDGYPFFCTMYFNKCQPIMGIHDWTTKKFTYYWNYQSNRISEEKKHKLTHLADKWSTTTDINVIPFSMWLIQQGEYYEFIDIREKRHSLSLTKVVGQISRFNPCKDIKVKRKRGKPFHPSLFVCVENHKYFCDSGEFNAKRCYTKPTT